jgi:hypothetical protein
MTAAWAVVIWGLVLFLIEAANLYITLKLRNSQLTTKAETLDEVAKTYKRQDVCEKEMQSLFGPAIPHARQPAD